MLILLLWTTLWTSVVTAHEFYNESLSLRALPRNNLLTRFKFSANSSPQPLAYYNDSVSDTSHYSFFPRAIGPILEQTNTRELHLRFGQGWWDAESWGELPAKGSVSGGTGVEVWAIIESPNSKTVMDQWKRLANSLSGLFCASLNFIDEKITAFPINTFVGEHSSFAADQNNTLFLLRAALPSEPICTENLTPFLKLLPTRGKAGVSSLLDGHKVFDSLWNSMSIDITTECEEDGCMLKMEQDVSIVIDVLRSIRKQEEGVIPKPIPGEQLRCDQKKAYDGWKCFPLPPPNEVKYSLKTLFGRKISGSAFKNEPSIINIELDPEYWKITKYAGLTNIDTLKPEQTTSMEILGTEAFDIEFESTDSSNVPRIQTPPLYVSRSLTGYSQDKGGFRVMFTNNLDQEVDFLYYETLPWFVRLYMSTMEAEIKHNGVTQTVVLTDYVQLLHYQSAIDRKRPSHMELKLRLPAQAQLVLNYKFDKSLLLYSEYPPDANHGFSVEPAVITVVDKNSTKLYELRTTSSLITLPTPDFSMPYNVIILTCTVMSLAFGSVFSLVTKRVVTEEEAEYMASQSNFGKLKAAIKSGVASVKQALKRK